MSTPHEDVQAGVVAFIRGLGISDLPSTQVYGRLTQNPANLTYPCVVVSIAGLTEERERIGFGVWAFTYPVLVLFSHRGDPKDPEAQALYENWRDTISWALEKTLTLPGISEPIDIACEPGGQVTGAARGRGEPGQAGDPLGPAWLKVAGSLVVRVTLTREG